ncbi:MAG: competence protein ComEA [Crocinitomicaceae bacterium]|jgi:competence protein ComEA
MISFTPRIISKVSASEEPMISYKEAKVVEEKILERKHSWKKKSKQWKPKKNKFKTPERRFDPNQYSESDWTKLGLSPKQAQVVVHFAERGLKSNDDLRKIYVLSEQFIVTIEDSTYYPEGYSYIREKDALTKEDKSQLLVPINSADVEALRKIPGIGAYFADKIVFYRDELGGYVHKEQLLEIWKFDIAKYQEVRNFIEIDEINFTTISINTATIDELKEHPYINFKIARSIVRMREQIGSYKTLDEIKRSKLIDEITYQKLKPYLSI